MKQQLHIAPRFALPVDVAGEAIAILAKRGAGKTNTATVLVEELVDAGVQVVIVDPVGAWWGIRSTADGKGDGLPVPILGGQHGDVPLEPSAGALIADVVVDTGSSLLLDLSDFPSKASIARFVVDFGEHLYRRKARASSLLHLVLEEADSFAPQKGAGDDARMRGAVEQIVRRGRSRGIGITMITQRSAVLNKDVLSQADVLIAMRTTSPHDVKAIEAWVDAHGEDELGVVASLPSLETGEAWFWNPERDLLEKAKVRRRRTFDSSATPKAGEKRVEPKRSASIDLAELGEQIAATAERVKAADPAELRKKVRELERNLVDEREARAKFAAAALKKPDVVETTVEISVLTDQDRELLAGVSQTIAESHERAAQAADALVQLLGEISTRVTAAPRAEGTNRRQVAGPREPALTPEPRRPAPSAGGAAASGVSGPQQRILNALAWFEAIGVDAPRRSPLGAVAGASPKSSGFEKNVSTLKTAGLIDYPAGGHVSLTAAGREAAEPPAITPTNRDLQEAVYRMISGPQATLLRVLIDAYPDGLSREELADRAGASVLSSGFEKNVSTLKSFELVDYPERGHVAALPLLFPEG